MKKMSSILILLALLVMLAPTVQATTLHVRVTPGAGEYGRLWDAWDAASSGDTILIHEGRYSDVRNKNYQLHTGYNSSSLGKANITISNFEDDRVILEGQMKFAPSPVAGEPKIDNITVTGLILDLSRDDGAYNRSGFYISANSGGHIGSINVENSVVYNASDDGLNDNALAYFEGGGVFDQSSFVNCTQINIGNAYQDDKGVHEKATGPIILPIMKNLIVWSNSRGVRSTHDGDDGDFSLDYSLVGDSLEYNFSDPSIQGPGTIVDVDPMFYSLDPDDPHFLYLSTATPASVLYGADDGGYMGAYPVYVPEPATLMILGLGSLLTFRRKRA